MLDSFINFNSLYISTLDQNLLPTGFEATFSNIYMGLDTPLGQLVLQSRIAPIDIKSQADLDNLSLSSMIFLTSQGSLSPSHMYILDDYIDENNNPVDLGDYISSSGVVIQAGKVFISIRATGTRLFLNNSDPAITVDKIELNFIITLYTTIFDLNGGEGIAPDSQ